MFRTTRSESQAIVVSDYVGETQFTGVLGQSQSVVNETVARRYPSEEECSRSWPVVPMRVIIEVVEEKTTET